MTISLTQKPEIKLCQPLQYFKRGIAYLVFGVAKSTKSGIKRGICFTGKAAGRLMWNNTLENLYIKTQNNKHIRTGLAFIWLLLFSWIGYLIYNTNSVHTDIVVSRSLAGYLFLASGCLFYFLRDIKRCILWNKRKHMREQIASYPSETLKKFLLSQNMTALQKELLKQKFMNYIDNKKIINAYEEIVLKEMDKDVNKIIEKYSSAAGIGCAVSPKWSLDYLLTTITFSKMLSEIAKAYHIKLSLSTFISIFIFGLAVLAASAMITLGIKQITEKHQAVIALLGGVGAWLSSKIIELAIPCCAMGTVGYAIQYALRPIKPQIWQ